MLLTRLFADAIRDLPRHSAAAWEPADRGRVIGLAGRAARLAVPVLIESEPGSGADSLARAIHECSERRSRPFVRIHCGGEESGGEAVSPAQKAAQAQGGTLLLQEVERLSPEHQRTLLRVIQESETVARATVRMARGAARIVATTSADLLDLVREGRFREDLYYRLHVIPIALAPLRARREELPDLARQLLERIAVEEGKPIPELTDEAATLLKRYDWPGNLRQLENAIFRAVALADGGRVAVAEFPQIAARVGGYAVEIPPVPARAPVLPTRAMPVALRDPRNLSLLDESGELRTLDELEAQIIRFALDHCGGHISAVSRRLGIGRSTLYRKLKDHGLENVPGDAAA